jgi:putative oxidoreductase
MCAGSAFKKESAMTLFHENRSNFAVSYVDSLAGSTSDIVLLIGRILLGWIFVRSGYGKIFDISAYAATFPARGLPPFLAYISVPVEFFGGVALMLGLATRYVVLVMVVFNIRRIQDGNFYKNMAMIGGFCFLFVCGSGRFSVDAFLRRRLSPPKSHD